MPFTRVIVDWSLIKDADQFYDFVLPQCGSPDWHGRNLNALNDAWVSGGISAGGPPFQFEMKNWGAISDPLIPMAKAVLDIAQASVASHGGTCVSI